MGKPLNVRQQRFVTEYMRTGIASRAYALAGYTFTTRDSLDASSSRLLGNAKIRREIRRREREMLKRSDITIEKLLSDAEEARKLALASGQPSAATGATQLQAKLVGLLIERKESGAPGEFAGLETPAQVIEAVRLELGEDAAKALAALVAKASPPPVIPASEEPIPTVSGNDTRN